MSNPRVHSYDQAHLTMKQVRFYVIKAGRTRDRGAYSTWAFHIGGAPTSVFWMWLWMGAGFVDANR